MMDCFVFSTKLTLGIFCSTSFQNGVFGSNGILPDQPQLNIDFQRDLSFPEMVKGSIYANI
jgi:hypothetical protein